MYRPAHFDEADTTRLQAAIAEARLATLVTFADGAMEASHVPMILDAGDGPHGALYGHLARGNPQWRRVDAAVPALAVFLGPEAYVSPAWYASKAETGKVVPTWNYVAVHATGPITFFDDAGRLRDIVTRLTDRHEASRAEPWAVTDAPAEFVAAHLQGIVGFKLAIERLEGKWKMSQNRSAEDRRGVIDGLLREGGEAEAAVARVMRDDGGR